jgi:hypothetical protein
MAVSKDRLDFIEEELAKIERELNTHTKQLQEERSKAREEDVLTQRGDAPALQDVIAVHTRTSRVR